MEGRQKYLSVNKTVCESFLNMFIFERVIEQRLHSYIDHIGFINKYQSGLRQANSTDDHLFRRS